MTMMARRERSSGEVLDALVGKGWPREVALETVAELVAERLIDDRRYAESLVRVLVQRGQGPLRIRRALVEAGIAPALTDTALEEGPDFRALAGEVRRRRFGAARPTSWPEKARQMRFLQYRGFSEDQISASLGPSVPEGMD